MKIKEIIFFCYGDSNLASTWSNVPYLFAKTLEEKGVVVHRVDISPSFILSMLYDRIFYPLCKRVTNNYCRFRNTSIVERHTNKLIAKAVNQFPSSDYCVFSCFDYYNKFNGIKTLLLCDWTYDVLLEREHRNPTKKEQRFMNQQREALEKSQCVVSLFPKCAQQLKTLFPLANVHYLGGYVINSFYKGDLSEDYLVDNKNRNKSLLFVGTEKYMQAALKLIEAVKILQKEDPTIKLNIIGMRDSSFNVSLPNNTKCWGFLHKDVADECNIYYELLKNTSLVVNTDPNWGGFSSIVESMFFYTPILVAPYEDFIKEFGDSISFGLYNQNFTASCMAENISKILYDKEYSNMCLLAHERVKDFTWSNYVDKLLEVM